jgi:RNA polymerase sigma-70 factor (sigma-E family)
MRERTARSPLFRACSPIARDATFSWPQVLLEGVVISSNLPSSAAATESIAADVAGSTQEPCPGWEQPPLEMASWQFDRYVRARSAALRRLAFLLTGDVHLAEDLVQTTLAKLLVRWDTVAARGDPHPYARTVLLHTALGWRRRRWAGERPSSIVPELPDRAAADAHGAVESRERLRRALLLLPPRQRAAVVLRHYEDLSEAEAAKTLGCTVGTVKSQTARGLDRLRSLLITD